MPHFFPVGKMRRKMQAMFPSMEHVFEESKFGGVIDEVGANPQFHHKWNEKKNSHIGRLRCSLAGLPVRGKAVLSAVRDAIFTAIDEIGVTPQYNHKVNQKSSNICV